MKIETLAVHAGHHVDPSTGAVSPAIHLSTTFERGTDGSYPQGYVYSRASNPNRQALEEALAALEGGEVAAAFASGSAAAMAVFQALSAGDHVIMPDDCYYSFGVLVRDSLSRWNLSATFVDMTDLGAIERAIQPNTRLIWVETPSNPLLKITDIQQVALIAHQIDSVCVCDNTWATPLLQQPLALGADLSVHATTKYLGGHSDVLGGAVIGKTSSPFFQRVRQIQTIGGAVAAPFDCWLVLRGVRTLPYRMRAHSENAQKVADFLNQHSLVEVVHYPGLQTHPGYEIAVHQMSSPGGMLSFQVKGGRDRAFAVAANVRLFTRATSLGAVESLIEHRASVEGPTTRTPDSLLRLSIGLEHPDDLIEDLAQALDAAK